MTGKIIVLFSLVFFFRAGGDTAGAEVLTLPAGLKIAAENSRLLKMAERDESISDAEALIEKSRLLPSVNASLSGTALAYQPGALFGNQTVPLSEREFLAYSISIQQTLYDFRANASRYEAGRMRAGTKRLETRRIRNLVAIGFALAYFDLLEAEKIVAVAGREVERVEAHLRDARNLYEEGVITKNDLLQAEVRLSDARQRLLSAGNQRAINVSRLNNIMVRPLNTGLDPVDPDGTAFPLTAVSREGEGEAVFLRPEVQIVDETLKALGLEELSKKAEYYPRIFARGSYDYTENRFQTHEGNWAMTIGLGVNLFSGGSTKAEIEKLGHLKMRLMEQRSKLLEDIRLEAETYLLSAGSAGERVSVTKDAVRQADENLRINRLRYEEGVGTATEVLDAVALMTVAETNYFRAVYDLRKAETAYLYSIGKDLLEVYK